MRYEQAMGVIDKSPKRLVGRQSAPKMRITWRFGRVVMLCAVPSFIDYTPTQGDMCADDWYEILEEA